MMFLIPASFSIVIICTFPLMTSISQFFWLNTPLSRIEIFGIFSSLAGVFFLLRPDMFRVSEI